MGLKKKEVFILAFQLFQILQVTKAHGCKTPFGTNGLKVHLFNCEPIIELLRRYENNLPPNERLFIQKSFLSPTDYQNNKTVCCDPTLNVSIAFESIGAEILRFHDSQCGDNTYKRVSFGAETTFMSHPWSVLLVYDTPQRFHCGGSLITNRYVLTAAHCVKQSNFPLIGVRLREHNTSSEKDCAYDLGGFEHCYAPVQDVGIEKVIIHQNYSHVTYDNDIALLRLDHFIEFERSIRPICLPEYQDQIFDKNYGIILGWGATENSTYSEILLEAVVPIKPLDHCRQIYRRRTIDDMKICGGGQNAIDTCKGDSGGPLVLRIEGYSDGRKFRYLQTAIVSVGSAKCGDERNFPTIFLRLSAYRNWIAENIEM